MDVFKELFADNSSLRHLDMSALLQWVQEQGGIGGIQKKFQQSDLGHMTQSWLGQQSSAHPIENNHLLQVFGSESIESLANKLGIDAQTAMSLLTTYLPRILVLLGEGNETGSWLSKAAGLLKGFLSRPS
ncbi:TPA: DUF937 domain-containing protein [Serratia marcescens]|uniref:DUF937 domain-containing protein n=2 Tax=Serratia TaxID=613 RepID=A0A9X9C195_9GAMM|nr:MULTISPECIES: YidB family protein [Serratia]MBS3894920.1 DUF937 domain-containing protein [Serratia marcescens]TXE26724.1 DUF937 domain-containing protein [Serratia ureilytica]HBC7421396.1 DUF937 domain-containing protein [Serratia marcescens]